MYKQNNTKQMYLFSIINYNLYVEKNTLLLNFNADI